MDPDDSNFYSQMAASLDSNSFDDSDEEEQVMVPSSGDVQQVAQSVDVDDMEANLFSSLSTGPPAPRRRASRQGGKPSLAKPLKDTATAVVTQTMNAGGTSGGAVKENKTEAKKDPESKKPKFDFEDDILDILSDGEDESPKKRVKPTIKLAKEPESYKTDSKPITSSTNDISIAGLELERPRTSRGIPPNKNGEFPITMDTATTPGPRPTSKDKSESLDAQSKSIAHKTPNDTKSAVTFDDDDDILGGLGFDDDRPSSRNKALTSSRLDDLLGVKKPPTKSETSKLGGSNTLSNLEDIVEPKNIVGREVEDDFQFGSYVPSSMEGSRTTPKKGNLKLPSGRRRGTSELNGSLALRPSTASPARKLVHFAENLEISDRPASSSAVLGPRKSLIAHNSSEGAFSIDGETADKHDKEPLSSRIPRSESEMKGDDDVIEGQPVAEIASFDDSSLFPLEPKQLPTSFIKGGPGPNSTTALFEDQPPAKSTSRSNKESTPTDNESKKATKDSEPLKHPVFPWQKTDKADPSSVMSRRQSSLQTVSTKQTPTNPTITSPSDSTGPQNAVLASFQEQLLQQQKQLQEQLASFQMEKTSALRTAQVSTAAEQKRLEGEVLSVRERVGELEREIKRKEAELAGKQKALENVKQDLSSSEEARQKLEEQCQLITDKLNTSDKEAALMKQELQTQLEGVQMKLYKSELEREQLQHTIESMKIRHTEEVEAIQKSSESKWKAMEESNQRRESRWKEEAASDVARFQDKLTLLEQEKTDALLAARKKFDAFEISKTNEIGRLKDVHYAAIEELKREHELDKQHLLNLHRQELEAVKAAHSHTRMLSDLSHKVETSTKDMSQLQAKLEHAHSTELDERMQRVRSHEEQLKLLETQLMKQKSENNAERNQLQSLIAKMESHVSQQKKQIEQECWQLQQDLAKLTAQQTAFEEERVSTLLKLETERERLEQAKEKFLTEQQQILSKCYEERRSVASERAELCVLQKKTQEREQRDKQLSLQSEAEREALAGQLREESAELAAERAKLRAEQQQLRVDREAVDRDRQKLENFGAEIQQRSLEIEQITETALVVREKGEQSLTESQLLKEQLSQQSQTLQAQREDLAKREKLLALEQLSLAQERRKLQNLKMASTDLSLEEGREAIPVLQLSTKENTEPQDSVLGISTASLSNHKGIEALSASANRSYSPRASPLHVSALAATTPHHLKTLLSKIDQSRNRRQWALDAKKDEEYLEQETNFIQSLQSNAYIY